MLIRSVSMRVAFVEDSILRDRPTNKRKARAWLPKFLALNIDQYPLQCKDDRQSASLAPIIDLVVKLPTESVACSESRPTRISNSALILALFRPQCVARKQMASVLSGAERWFCNDKDINFQRCNGSKDRFYIFLNSLHGLWRWNLCNLWGIQRYWARNLRLKKAIIFKWPVMHVYHWNKLTIF